MALLATLRHGETQKALLVGGGSAGDKRVGCLNDALEKIRALDGLTENHLLPPGVEFQIVPLHVPAVQVVELLVLVVPVGSALARLQVIEVLAPFLLKRARLRAVVREEIKRGFG